MNFLQTTYDSRIHNITKNLVLSRKHTCDSSNNVIESEDCEMLDLILLSDEEVGMDTSTELSINCNDTSNS